MCGECSSLARARSQTGSSRHDRVSLVDFSSLSARSAACDACFGRGILSWVRARCRPQAGLVQVCSVRVDPYSLKRDEACNWGGFTDRLCRLARRGGPCDRKGPAAPRRAGRRARAPAAPRRGARARRPGARRKRTRRSGAAGPKPAASHRPSRPMVDTRRPAGTASGSVSSGRGGLAFATDRERSHSAVAVRKTTRYRGSADRPSLLLLPTRYAYRPHQH